MEIKPRMQMDDVPKRVSPVDKLISDLPGTFYKLSEVAEIIGVAEITLRRLLKKPGVTAPSMVMQQGGMTVYLYTPKDVEELRSLTATRIEER